MIHGLFDDEKQKHRIIMLTNFSSFSMTVHFFSSRYIGNSFIILCFAILMEIHRKFLPPLKKINSTLMQINVRLLYFCILFYFYITQ